VGHRANDEFAIAAAATKATLTDLSASARQLIVPLVGI
jgi:hypothetical protein